MSLESEFKKLASYEPDDEQSLKAIDDVWERVQEQIHGEQKKRRPRRTAFING